MKEATQRRREEMIESFLFAREFLWKESRKGKEKTRDKRRKMNESNYDRQRTTNRPLRFLRSHRT